MSKYKKNLNKMVMFNKLMPSGTTKGSVAPNVMNQPDDNDLTDENDYDFVADGGEHPVIKKILKKKKESASLNDDSDEEYDNEDFEQEEDEEDEAPVTRKPPKKKKAPQKKYDYDEYEDDDNYEDDDDDEVPVKRNAPKKKKTPQKNYDYDEYEDDDDDNVEEQEFSVSRKPPKKKKVPQKRYDYDEYEDDDDDDVEEQEFSVSRKPVQKKKAPQIQDYEEKSNNTQVEKNNNENEIVVMNIYEKVIDMKLDDAIAKFNCCNCQFCRNNIIVATLNNLEPKYVVAQRKELKQLAENTEQSNVTKFLMKSILQVKTKGHKK